MPLNPNPKKQAIELRCSNKRDKNRLIIIIIDSQLIFNEHIQSKTTKCNKIIGLMKKLSLTLSREGLLTIYKPFVGPNLDYANIIYDNSLNESFKRKIEMV